MIYLIKLFKAKNFKKPSQIFSQIFYFYANKKKILNLTIFSITSLYVFKCEMRTQKTKQLMKDNLRKIDIKILNLTHLRKLF